MIKVDLDVLMTLDFQIGLRMDGLTETLTLESLWRLKMFTKLLVV